MLTKTLQYDFVEHKREYIHGVDGGAESSSAPSLSEKIGSTKVA